MAQAIEGGAAKEARGRACPGRAEALRVALVRQPTTRFGPLPGVATHRIAAASLGELDRWVERVITAASLDGVFDAG